MSTLEEQQQPNVGERANSLAKRGRSANSQPIQVHRQSESKQKDEQESANSKNPLKDCLPSDTKTFLFALVTIVYLIVGVIHFFGWTGDTSMLTYLLGVVGGYKGLAEVTSLFPQERREDTTHNWKRRRSL